MDSTSKWYYEMNKADWEEDNDAVMKDFEGSTGRRPIPVQLHRLFCPSRYWVTNRQELVLIGIGMDIQTITNELNKSLLPEQEMNILSAKTDENFLVDPFLGSGKERFKRR